MTPSEEDKRLQEEEARAEEAFINDREDEVDNPLVPNSAPTLDEPQAVSAEAMLESASGEQDVSGVASFGNNSATQGDGAATAEAPVSNEQIFQSRSTENVVRAGYGQVTEATDSNVNEGVAESAIEQANQADVTTGIANGVQGVPNQASVATAANVPKEKKSKKGLAIALIVAFVLLVGGTVAAILLMNNHEKPERMLKDAVVKYLQAEDVSYESTMKYVPANDDDSTNSLGLEARFKMNDSDNGSGGNGTITIKREEGEDVEVNLDAAYLKDGNGRFYFKLGEVKNLSSLFGSGDTEETSTNNGAEEQQATEGSDDDCEDGAASEETTKCVDASSQIQELYARIFDTFVNKVGETWYEIDLNEVATSGTATGSDSTIADDDPEEVAAQCSEEANKVSSKAVRQSLAKVYEAHPFIGFKEGERESNGTLEYFTIQKNDTELENFGKAAGEISEIKAYLDCTGTTAEEFAKKLVGDKDDDEEVSEEADSTKQEAVVKIGVTPWSHELKEITTSLEGDGGASQTASVVFDYSTKEVEEPVEAKSIKEFSKDLVTSIKEGYQEYGKTYAKQVCAEQKKAGNISTNEEMASCEAQVNGMIDESVKDLNEEQFDVSDLVQSGAGLI
ncbi:hypothetical protein IKF15_02580 [Candidatus Saccharibacteria bacterium]|nr:hypothetical protein [Candidatus Saccharibacteria bacterium]